jgi:hypothetical protein
MTAFAVADISSMTAKTATATTDARLSSWIMNYSLEKCIKYATEAANTSGFTDSQESWPAKNIQAFSFTRICLIVLTYLP